MSLKDKVFSDVFAQKQNLVTGIEARTKIAFISIALVINLMSPTIFSSLGIAVFCLITLLSIKIPPGLLLLRLTMPLVMAVIVLIIQTFLYGGTPLFTIPIWGFHLVGYAEGLARGLLIMGRVIGGVSLILFLSMSTPTNKLLMAACWFRVPKLFIELTLLVYRYVFVLIEEVVAIRNAQKVRLGYRNRRQGMKSLGILGGSLILRAYDRADRIFDAMIARGYTGTMAINYQPRFGRKDYLATLGLGAILVIFYLMGQLGA
ncbi:cobalt ECF transporter T component CbiQ [Dehalococcoidia bacterium]|nr:cobalt ECF transporter T component CbiQ [Dehalococcoidia bacterium]